MRITVLVENTTISSEYKPKHGLCLYIETRNNKILFDLGPNDLFLKNAKKMGVDISSVDTVIISHGHTDHGGALKLFLTNNSSAKIYVQEKAFERHYAKVLGIPFYVGLDSSLKDNQRIILTKNQVAIDETLILFSGVTERESYPTSNHALLTKNQQGYVVDNFEHEQNLIIIENDKAVLFSGCAHNGIINIQKKAEEIIDAKITDVISGFHLYNPVSRKSESNEFIAKVGNKLKENDTFYHTCHCTGKKAYDNLKNIMGEKIDYLATGKTIKI